MRKFLIAAAAFAIAAPAAAQQAPSAVGAQAPGSQAARPGPKLDPRDEELRRNLPDPAEMKAMGEVAARAMEAMMEVPIGPLREAVEGRKLSRRERQETIGDVARRDDPNFKERMRDQMGVASVAMAALMEQMVTIGPVLRSTLEDVARRTEEAARQVPERPRK
ncbi:MAG TPA: hypothetical protein VF582_03405 [Allosphingosinicella sp.]|jgi:hypothetical protein